MIAGTTYEKLRPPKTIRTNLGVGLAEDETGFTDRELGSEEKNFKFTMAPAPAQRRSPTILPPLNITASSSAPDALSFAWEPFGEVVEEAMPLLRRHYDGLGLPYPFDPDFAGMLLAASQGLFRVAVVRNARGHIVGYCTGAVSYLQCSRGIKELMVPALYLEPDYRGSLCNLKTLLGMMDDFAREAGCVRLLLMPLGRMRHGIGRALCRMGWSLSDSPIYERELP